MTNPQQPELGRSGKGATSEGSAKARAERLPVTAGESLGPVPEDNLPGHHPEQEQDKPTGPPPVPPLADDGDGNGRGGRRRRTRAKAATATGTGRQGAGTATATAERGDAADGADSAEAPARAAAGEGVKVRFAFAFDPLVAPAAAVFGATPFSAWVDVDATHVTVRFGPWSLRTALENVVGAERTGPYSWWKVAGPPHLSLADRGVTFATSTKGGVCVRFREPVAAAVPFGLLRHPSMTVTVDDPDALVEALTVDR